MQELVSIIIPTYNRAHFIGQTLDSVLVQTYENWECIVVDDGSSDYTDELLEFYCERDNRIKFYHRPTERPKGANACRNYGFEVSKGDYIQWLDSDDRLSDNKLKSQVNLLNMETAFCLAFCKWGIYNEISGHLNIYDNLEVYRNFDEVGLFLNSLAIDKGYLPPHCYLIPRKLITYSGLWIEKLEMNQDGEYMIRTMLNVKKILFEEESHVIYRNGHQNRISHLNNKRKVGMMIQSWKIIEGYLSINDIKQSNFISKAKSSVYKNVKESYPELIIKNEYFFKDVIKSDKNETGILNKKLKKLFKLFK